MKTAGKVILGVAALALIISATKKKKSAAQTSSPASNPNTVITNPFENRIIIMQNGNWFAVHDGKRWFTSNIQSVIDFEKQYPGNQRIEGVTDDQVKDLPIAGSIKEGLNYVTEGLSFPGLGLNWQLCRRENPDGSHTEYNGRGGDNPCPYGGTPYYPYRDKQKNLTVTGV